MEKNAYATYNILPMSKDEPENDEQYFVVQEDGTFLINRQIQYVTQTEEGKEALDDTYTVYDVSSQQFFVDVENSAELITVADQYILPDGERNLYGNSYLLQPVSSTTTEPMQEDVTDQYKQVTSQDNETVNNSSKPSHNCAEITLTDDQYQLLKQKGWILIETSDKIFVLNSLGLHDITTDKKLIQKLKNEIQNNNELITSSGATKIENVDSSHSNNISQNFLNQQETIELTIENGVLQNQNKRSIESYIVNDTAIRILEEKQEIDNQVLIINDTQNETDLISPEKKEVENETTNTVAIKTKFMFRDIPDKICLGKTVNGKKLVAKVVKVVAKQDTEDNILSKPCSNPEIIYNKDSENEQLSISEMQFLNLVAQSVRGSPEAICSQENIVATKRILEQILHVTNLQQTILDNNLVVTKVQITESANGTVFSAPFIVTGRVTLANGTVYFNYIPDLLPKLLTSLYESAQHPDEGHVIKADSSLYHMHISETKQTGKIDRISLMLNKRHLSTEFVMDVKRQQPNTIYACSACAAIFKTEQKLKEHQEAKCSDMLTIITNNINQMEDTYCVKQSGKDKQYSCLQCGANFNRLSHCLKHVKTHVTSNTSRKKMPTGKDDQNTDTEKKSPEVYKCNMCHSTYIHQSTLSKHILAKHIKMNSK